MKPNREPKGPAPPPSKNTKDIKDKEKWDLGNEPSKEKHPT